MTTYYTQFFELAAIFITIHLYIAIHTLCYIYNNYTSFYGITKQFHKPWVYWRVACSECLKHNTFQPRYLKMSLYHRFCYTGEQIGRASCRERVEIPVVGDSL